MASPAPAARQQTVTPQAAALGILSAISLCHGVNDLLQSVLPAVYPILKTAYALDFGQIGLITFVNTVTASLLQPVVGLVTDARPKPYSLAIGMGFTLVGLLLFARGLPVGTAPPERCRASPRGRSAGRRHRGRCGGTGLVVLAEGMICLASPSLLLANPRAANYRCPH